VVPLPLLETIYSAIAPRIKEKGGRLYVVDPSGYDPTHRTKLFFVDDGGDSVAGPFGPTGLKVFLRSEFKDSSDNVGVYVVSTTHKSLALIRSSPLTAPREEAFDLEAATDLF